MLAEGLGLALYAGLVGGKLCYSVDLQIEPQGVREKGMNSTTSCAMPDKRKKILLQKLIQHSDVVQQDEAAGQPWLT